MTLGVDYASERPNVGQMFDVGVRFAGRYVGPGSLDKRLTHDEAMAINGAGIACVSLVEGYARDALRGYDTGRDHALAAVRELATIGAPADRPMYFGVDWDMQVTEWPEVSQYLTGAAHVIGWDRVGVYGGIRAVTLAAERNGIRWLFQAYGWSGGRWYPPATLRQTHNHQWMAGDYVDLCWSTEPDVGGWFIAGSHPSNGEDEELDANQATQLAEIHERITNINASLYLATGTEGIPAVPADDRWGVGGQSAALVDQVSYLCHMVRQLSDGLAAVATALGQAGNPPGVDLAAVAKALATEAEFVAGVGSAVRAGLGTLTGSLTLTGPLSGRFEPPQPG